MQLFIFIYNVPRTTKRMSVNNQILLSCSKISSGEILLFSIMLFCGLAQNFQYVLILDIYGCPLML